MPIKIIAVGKKHETWVHDGIDRYEKRLRDQFRCSWLVIPHSSLSTNNARRDESKLIINKLNFDDFVILLDERGKQFSSPELANFILKPLNASKNLVFVIGGAYGVDSSVHGRADFVWSLSPLVFPHQLVRLMLVEQLYRSQEINKNSGYHHG